MTKPTTLVQKITDATLGFIMEDKTRRYACYDIINESGHEDNVQGAIERYLEGELPDCSEMEKIHYDFFQACWDHIDWDVVIYEVWAS